jgi:hypothetical protein
LVSDRVRSKLGLGLVVAVAAAVAALAATAGPAQGARGLLKGLYDDTQTLYGNPDRAYPVIRSLRTDVIRINLYWGGEFGVAPNRRPARATDPNDPAYDWGLYDRAVNFAARHNVQVVFSIWGTPGWANRFRGLRSPPIKGIDLRNFAFAAARRYGGSFVLRQTTTDAEGNEVVLEERLPRVRYWMAWNEPNNPAFLSPQYRLVKGKAVAWSPRVYAGICNAVVQGVRLSLVRGNKTACGVTAPRGNNSPRNLRPSISPIPFLRGMKKAGARGFNAYAHHPYYGHRTETPTKKPRTKNAVTLGNINTLVTELNKLYGRGMRLWVTEYGYQTRPERLYAVTLAQQARYLTQAYSIARRHPRIDMMVWFMLRDDRNLGLGWQSGLFTASGARKPAYNAFLRVP